MIDINNLTLVQSLALNTIYFYNKYKRVENYMCLDERLERCGLSWSKSMKNYMDLIPEETRERLAESTLKFIKNPNWINERFYMNQCKEMMWPSVKLPGYTKQQAIAEFREVIEFVRRRYEEEI